MDNTEQLVEVVEVEGGFEWVSPWTGEKRRVNITTSQDIDEALGPARGDALSTIGREWLDGVDTSPLDGVTTAALNALGTARLVEIVGSLPFGSTLGELRDAINEEIAKGQR